MDFKEALAYLYASLPVFHRVGPAALKPGLDNTIRLCEHLGNPQTKFRSIHIAGTNGKGSTSHMLAAVLQTAGYKTGLYTSPHLKNFTERIKINGIEIPETDVVDFVKKNIPLMELVKPSFFEVTVAMAFDYFARNQVDVAVIETGLGGRLDSTNIIIPLISLITNISFDHQGILGNSLPQIAAEKAGIIKKGVPVIISERQEEVEEVFRSKAALENAPLTYADQLFRSLGHTEDGYYKTVKVQNLETGEEYDYALPLQGDYQVKNITGVLACLEKMKVLGFHIPPSAVAAGLSETVSITGLKGRWQILNRAPLIICDTGHNEAGIQFIVRQLSGLPFDKLYWVLGLVNDKDADSILKLLPVEAYYIFCQAKIPRAMDATQLQLKCMQYGLRGEVVPDVTEAYKKAKSHAREQDLVMVGGSTFVVGEIEDL